MKENIGKLWFALCSLTVLNSQCFAMEYEKCSMEIEDIIAQTKAYPDAKKAAKEATEAAELREEKARTVASELAEKKTDIAAKTAKRILEGAAQETMEAENKNRQVEDTKIALTERATDVCHLIVNKMNVAKLSIDGNHGKLEFFLYYPKEIAPNQKLPCLVFLHGGNEYGQLRISAPETSYDKILNAPGTFYMGNHITFPMLPMIGAIVSRKCAVASITFRNENQCTDQSGNGIGENGLLAVIPGFGKSIKEQIKEQVAVLKQQPTINPEKIFLVGHSFGGEMVIDFLANEVKWLNENVEAIGVYAGPTKDSIPAMPQLSTLTKKVHLFHGTGDFTVMPSETKALIEYFEGSGFSRPRWQLHAYKDSSHTVHRITPDLNGANREVNVEYALEMGKQAMAERYANFGKFINDICGVLLDGPTSNSAVPDLDICTEAVGRQLAKIKEKRNGIAISGQSGPTISAAEEHTPDD
ncbi:hypothetical protein FACS1894126_1310 [Alphaproteobacteria bacterium]|nr:hypothetical protein FACS1894126_1310 [Alphaproteobacteria bacterium]